MKTQLKLSDTNIIDITNDIIMGNVVLSKRCDEAFGLGSFTFESKTINYNIPPYTPLIIDDVYYLCSSNLSENLITRTYIHSVEVIDAASILSRFVLGSKNFSVKGTNRKDYEKIAILCELVKQKYGVSIIISNASDLIKEVEYTFGAGTTFYDMLCEILRNYNKSIIVKSITTTTIEVSFISLDGLSYTINEKDILNYTINQNIDDYCKRLEGEMTNVIDRTNKIVLDAYTCRVDDVKLDYDNCKLILPTRIEKLATFKVNSSLSFAITNIKGKYFSIYRTGYSDATGWTYDIPTEEYTLFDWIYDIASSLSITYSETPIYELLNQMATYYYINLEDDILVNYKFTLKSTRQFTDDDGKIDWLFNLEWSNSNNEYPATYFDYTDWVLEKNKYDTLTAREKPKYAYYKSGDNYIDGMNVTYKDDFWNTILGIAKLPFFSQHQPEIETSFTNESGASLYITSYELASNPVVNKYYIEYYAITNPLISVEKNDNMLDCSRSFSKGNNFIDFDKLINAMNINNSWLGKPELTLELDVSDYLELPTITNKIVFKGTSWYVINYTITYSLNNTIMNLNLASNYNKLADVVGVSTQFEETKNPIENIIERPILIENSDFEIDISNLWLRFKFDNGDYLFKRGCLMTSNSYKIIYCEMLDHYCFDKSSVREANNVYVVTDVAYGNEYNEAKSVSIDIVKLPKNLTLDNSMYLPYYSGDVNVVAELGTHLVYKDARERLLFTILLK